MEEEELTLSRAAYIYLQERDPSSDALLQGTQRVVGEPRVQAAAVRHSRVCDRLLRSKRRNLHHEDKRATGGERYKEAGRS
jgi:hypothetical protein